MLERVGGPTAAVEGDHQLAGEPLVQRMAVGEGGQSAQQFGVAAPAQLDVVQIQHGPDPLQSSRLALGGEPGAVHAGAHLAPPERQGLLEQPRRLVLAARLRGGARLGAQGAEAVQVDGGRVEGQFVAAVASRDPRSPFRTRGGCGRL